MLFYPFTKAPLFSEYFLAQLLDSLETWNLFYPFNIRFYIADNIRPDLVKRLRRFGSVILKSSKTTPKADPKYWKLSILSENNLGMVLMVEFWQFFFLIRVMRKRIFFQIDYERAPTELSNQFRGITPELVSVSPVPVANIDELIAQRNPIESYQEFISSTVIPRISTATGMLVGKTDGAGTLKSWFRVFLPLRLYAAMSTIRTYLKIYVRSIKIGT